ncbi:hypothetical protein NM688_g1282 [Phlebia brevispora]|uniref:Uncharacterized protein n=1 Tax=Phlebia brevispora TaxID=194682 RepID=A0ACC1TCA0_9APHY|nr:hypothetical protein NM688_g1282 [Phlebia brevispora]
MPRTQVPTFNRAQVIHQRMTLFKRRPHSENADEAKVTAEAAAGDVQAGGSTANTPTTASDTKGSAEKPDEQAPTSIEDQVDPSASATERSDSANAAAGQSESLQDAEQGQEGESIEKPDLHLDTDNLDPKSAQQTGAPPTVAGRFKEDAEEEEDAEASSAVTSDNENSASLAAAGASSGPSTKPRKKKTKKRSGRRG